MNQLGKTSYSYNHEICASVEPSSKPDIKFAKEVVYITQHGDVKKLTERHKIVKNHSKTMTNISSTEVIKNIDKKHSQSTSTFHAQKKDRKIATNIQSHNSMNGTSLASSRLDNLSKHCKASDIGEFIGRILAHAVLDHVNDGNLNITGIDNILLRPIIEYSVLGKIRSQDRKTDQYYLSLGRGKRLVYRKSYQKIKKSISQPSQPTKQIKGWKAKRLHKITSGIKHSVLDQPELKNVHLKEKVSSLINKHANTYVKNSSLYIDKINKETSKHRLGYAISSGFISVLRERAPDVTQRVILANNIYDTIDATITAKNTVTYSKFSTAFSHYFSDQINGMSNLISDTTKAASNATNEVSFNKFLTAFKNYWYG